MPFQTWVARFVVDHGQVTEEGGRLRTFPRRRLDEPEVDLHLLAEPAGPKAEEFAAQTLEAIGREFLKDSLSLTGGLLRALRSTNQVLLDWNRRSIAKEHVAVGVTAAVVRGSTVYLAQAGPTLVFVRRRGALTRLVPEDAGSVALGEGVLEPELRRIEMEPGDVVIAASTAIDTLMDVEALDQLIERGTDIALPELYLRARGLPNFALYAITCLEGAQEEGAGEGASAAAPAAAPASGATSVTERPDEPVLSFEARPDEPEDRVPALSMPRPLDISRPVVRLRNDQFSGRVDYPRTTGSRGGLRLNMPPSRLLAISAVVAVALFIAAFAVPDLIQEGRQVQASTLIDRALTTYSFLDRESDPGRRRALLEETRRLTAEALRIEPGNVTAAELRQQAGAALTAMDNVFDLGQMQSVTILGRQVTGEVAIDRAVVAGGNAYLLDTRGRRVIMVPVATPGPPAVLLEEGQTYGGVQARRPQFMVWDAAGSRLLVLDSDRRLFEVRPGVVQSLALRRSASWASVSDLAAYDGNLYVLDPKGNQIHRYLPAASGFDSEPTGLLGSRVNISSAVGLAVQTDIFILTREGKVRRFRNGVDVTLSLAGIDRPLQAPSGLYATAASDELYIADAGNKRVVVADREGVFRRQLVSNSITDLRAMAIDPAAGQLYVVVGDELLTAPLVR
jgi:hypothetical protein